MHKIITRFRLHPRKFTAQETWELVVDKGRVGEDMDLTYRWREKSR